MNDPCTPNGARHRARATLIGLAAALSCSVAASAELVIENLPAGLETIARLYGVESLLSGATPQH